jgi:hypothetical protein
MTESPFLLAVFCGVWTVRQAAMTDRPAWYAGAGLSFGLAYLTRPEGLNYFAVLGLLLALSHLARRTFWRPATLVRLGLAGVVCLAVMAPYLLYLHRATGHWILSGKVGLILDIAPAYLADDQAAHDRAVSRLDSAGTEIMWASPERFERSLSAYILADPRRFVAGVRQNIASTATALFHEGLLPPGIVALAAVGLFGRPWSRRRWADEMWLGAALLPLAGFWLFFVIDRFLIGAVPVGLLWAAAGLSRLAGWARASLRSLWPAAGRLPSTLAAALPAVAVLVFCLGLPPGVFADRIPRMPWAHVEAGRWLADQTPPDAAIMTRNSEIALYADRPLVASPNAAWPQVLTYARARNVIYYLVDSYELTRLRPQLAAFLDPTRAPQEATHVRTFNDSGATLLYRLAAP